MNYQPLVEIGVKGHYHMDVTLKFSYLLSKLL